MAIPRHHLYSMKSWLQFIFIIQVALAGLLFFSQLPSTVAPWKHGTSDRPTPPISPGDQRRPYYPDASPFNQSKPAILDIPENERPPKRLQITTSDVEGLGFVVVLNGEINHGDSTRVRSALSDLPRKPDFIALNSPGGVVLAALEIGRVIREAEISTAVLSGSYCLSSCPYILAGGLSRMVSRSGAVGLHQHYYDTPQYLPVFLAVTNIQANQGNTMEYLVEMGVQPSLMLYSLKTPPNEVYLLVEEELTETSLATQMID